MCRASSNHGRDEKFIQSAGWKNLNGREHFGDLGVDGKIILKWILGKQGGNVWIGCVWIRIGTNDKLM
jgi:hypothetical protein